MSKIISDFFQVGTLRFVARALMGLRGLFIVVSLSPYALGEYTIWLLFIFYFSMLDFGVLAGLERDIPHYQGINDAVETKKHSDAGWSAYFVLSTGASLLLGVISFLVFEQWILSVLLVAYLFTDKIYRAFDSGSRIHLRYMENGIAQLINAAVSLLIILVLLPYMGAYGVLVGFIIAAICSAAYLFGKTKLVFEWVLRIKEIIKSVKNAFSLAVIVYSIQFYHMIALTIIAFLYDKPTLGYFAFAFRIFQICLALFPSLIQEIMRTRMYFHVAQVQDGQSYFKKLLFPMGVYCVITSFFWLFVYWWADWGIGYFAPTYTNSIGTLKILTVALVPLGIAKICSDYLCSHVHKKAMTVALVWGIGIILQGVAVIFACIDQSNLSYEVPMAYLISTFSIYVFLGRVSFEAKEGIFSPYLHLIYLLMPLAIASAVTYALKAFWFTVPANTFVLPK